MLTYITGVLERLVKYMYVIISPEMHTALSYMHVQCDCLCQGEAGPYPGGGGVIGGYV